MTRLQHRAIAIVAALIVLAAVAAAGTSMATASGTGCPAGAQCLTRVIITDHAPGMSAPFLIEDNEGRAPGHNAPMFWADGFQAGSVNPVCADAVRPYLAHEACLGGITPLSATGGHPVLGLCLRMGATDCGQWEVLTAGDIALLHAMRRAGLTPRDLRVLAAFAHAREARR